MKRNMLLLLLAAVLIVSGCSKQKEETEKEPSVKQTEQAQPADSKPAGKYPLTGIAAANEETDNRAVAVMINNHPEARPQTGLSSADIVYELLAEGDITRFLAVYQSEMPEEAGPVRSARDYYIELAKGLNCVYICHGNSPDAKTLLDEGYIDALNGLKYDGTLFKRSSDRKAPHNSYITFANIQKGAEQNSIDMTGAPAPMHFLSDEELENPAGEPADEAQVKYGSDPFNSVYTFDPDSGKYSRSAGGEQTVEKEGQTPIELDNILVIEAQHKVTDDKGRRTIDLVSGGKGLLLQKGKVLTVEWKNEDGVIVPFKDGKEAGLVPGKTWVSVIPQNPGLDAAVKITSRMDAGE